MTIELTINDQVAEAKAELRRILKHSDDLSTGKATFGSSNDPDGRTTLAATLEALREDVARHMTTIAELEASRP